MKSSIIHKYELTTIELSEKIFQTPALINLHKEFYEGF